MSRWIFFWNVLSHYKYIITIVIGILVVGVFDENSFMQKIKYEFEIRDLEEEINKYNASYERDSRQLRMLKSNPKNIEKIARERYFMKADDEDIFVLSDDEQPNTTHEESTK